MELALAETPIISSDLITLKRKTLHHKVRECKAGGCGMYIQT